MTEFPALPVPAQLVFDEAMWRYRSGVAAGHGYAHVRVWTTHPTGHLAIVTEVGLGASITNSAEFIWADLLDRFGEPLVMLEHWPTGEGFDHHTDTLDQVLIGPGRRPGWQRVWPTPPANAQHAAHETWMREHARRLLAETLQTRPGQEFS